MVPNLAQLLTMHSGPYFVCFGFVWGSHPISGVFRSYSKLGAQESLPVMLRG